MRTPLRILTAGHSYSIAINRSLLREVAKDPQFEITVAAPNTFYGDLRRIVLDTEPAGSSLKLVGIDTSWSRFIHLFRYNVSQLRPLLRASRWQVFHAWEEPYIFAGYQLARLVEDQPVPFCFVTYQNNNKSYPPPFGYFEQRVLRRSQAWITGGNLVGKAMCERGYPAAQMRLLPLAVDTQAFRPLTPARKQAVRTELGLHGTVIGFSGRLTKDKGVDVLMHAMEQVQSKTPWTFLFLGSGPEEQTIRDWAQARGWSDRVRIHLAKHHEVAAYVGAMDFLVAPSQTMPNWKEQFGRMITEAYACGVPAIVSDSGEIPYVAGDAAIILPERDIAAWANAIGLFLGDEALRAERGRQSFAHVQQYSVPAVAAQYREFYRWLSEQPCQ